LVGDLDFPACYWLRFIVCYHYFNLLKYDYNLTDTRQWSTSPGSAFRSGFRQVARVAARKASTPFAISEAAHISSSTVMMPARPKVVLN
jgi:hypothetical protein